MVPTRCALDTIDAIYTERRLRSTAIVIANIADRAGLIDTLTSLGGTILIVDTAHTCRTNVRLGAHWGLVTASPMICVITDGAPTRCTDGRLGGTLCIGQATHTFRTRCAVRTKRRITAASSMVGDMTHRARLGDADSPCSTVAIGDTAHAARHATIHHA